MKKENEQNFEVIETIENEDFVTDEVNDELEFVLVEDGDEDGDAKKNIGTGIAVASIILLGVATSYAIVYKEDIQMKVYVAAIKRSEKKIEKEKAKKQKLEEKKTKAIMKLKLMEPVNS